MTHDIPRFGTPDDGLTWASTGTHHGEPALMALAMAGQFPPAPEVPVDELLTRAADEPAPTAWDLLGIAPDHPGGRNDERARLAEAEATIVRAQDALGSDHPVWWILDDYDGSMDSIKDLVAERDKYREHSVRLNSVAYRIAEALAEEKGAERYEGDPLEQAERLIAERDTLRARVAELHARVAGAIRLADLSPLYGLDETWRRDNETFNASLPPLEDGEVAPMTARVVCLCGSTRFVAEYEIANAEETLAGRIVLSSGVFAPDLSDETKAMLDELHKRKIDIADEILVINPGGYIGTSTRSEIEYATAHGKPVRYLVEPGGRRGGAL